jgi:hypothetical protein
MRDLNFSFHWNPAALSSISTDDLSLCQSARPLGTKSPPPMLKTCGYPSCPTTLLPAR